MNNKHDITTVGVLGATSLVGKYLLPLLREAGLKVIAFSRHTAITETHDIEWRRPGENIELDWLVCLAPIWVLVEQLDWLESLKLQRLVILSSTSRFTKQTSSVDSEQNLAQQLADGELQLRNWAEERDIDCVILRPTLIYGLGKDKNVSEIARFITRFGFFPLLGQASGLRQPVHAEDIAGACLAALDKEHSFCSSKSPEGAQASNTAYNLSGGETLGYRDMVIRLFQALGKKPRLVHIPLWVFKLALALVRIVPRYKHWSPAMAERMNQDLVFDHSAATRDLAFKPRGFRLNAEDLPK